MVSKLNLLLIGSVILLFGLASTSTFRVRGSVNLPKDSMEDPKTSQIRGLNQILGQAKSIFKSTFKDPIIPKGLGGGPCRGPNCLGIFQAKGTRTSFDPFTGQRLAVGGSPQFQAITGADFALNQSRITQGNKIKLDLSEFIANITNQIGLLEKPNNVTL